MIRAHTLQVRGGDRWQNMSPWGRADGSPACPAQHSSEPPSAAAPCADAPAPSPAAAGPGALAPDWTGPAAAAGNAGTGKAASPGSVSARKSAHREKKKVVKCYRLWPWTTEAVTWIFFFFFKLRFLHHMNKLSINIWFIRMGQYLAENLESGWKYWENRI